MKQKMKQKYISNMIIYITIINIFMQAICFHVFNFGSLESLDNNRMLYFYNISFGINLLLNYLIIIYLDKYIKKVKR